MIVDGKRALAHIEKVTNIRPIEGADNIEQCNVLGWNLICKKGEFKENDPCVYIEIDSKVPEREEFEFLRAKGFKVKTMKLSKFGVISQGLALPKNIFKELNDLSEGTDVTDILGIRYSVEEDNSRKGNIDPNKKYQSMKSRHPKFFKHKIVKKLMRYEWFRKFIFIFLGNKKDMPKLFPNKFEFIHKTDEERCLFGRTKILTDNGWELIESIVNQKLKRKVLSVNSEGKFEWKPIISYQKYNCEPDELLTIRYNYFCNNRKKQTSICCSKDHRFYTEQGYVKAENLSVGDNVYTMCNGYGNDAIEALYGMLLGDSNIKNDKRCDGQKTIGWTQGENQLDYLRYKTKLFANDKITISKDISDAHYGSKPIYKASLPVNPIVSMAIKNDWLVENRKTVTDSVIDKITAISLAFWYMDDGNLSYRDNINHSPVIRLNTQNFSFAENEKLVNMLKNNFGIDCHLAKDKIAKDGHQMYHIRLDSTSVYKFLELITPYMCYSMAYKTLPDLEKYLETVDLSYTKQQILIPSKIISIENGQQKIKAQKNPKYIFDIEVQDNHNFFADGILTHNCENMPFILNNKTPLIVTEKLDGTSTTFILERTKKNKNKYEFYICSRNVRILKPNQKCYHDHNIYCDMAIKYDIENVLTSFMNDRPDLDYVCIQGESVGSVQGNPLKLKEDDFYAFNFITSDVGRWDSWGAKNLLNKWGIKFVPIIATDFILPDTMEEMKEMATGKSVINPNVLREGLVYRCAMDNTISFKNVSREYLLKHNQ